MSPQVEMGFSPCFPFFAARSETQVTKTSFAEVSQSSNHFMPPSIDDKNMSISTEVHSEDA